MPTLTDATSRTTEYRRNVDGLLEELVCHNGDVEEVTSWTYGGLLVDTYIARNDLLRSKTYPGPQGGTKSYAYNRQSEPRQMTDENGTVHDLTYDLYGRGRQVILDQKSL